MEWKMADLEIDGADFDAAYGVEESGLAGGPGLEASGDAAGPIESGPADVSGPGADGTPEEGGADGKTFGDGVNEGGKPGGDASPGSSLGDAAVGEGADEDDPAKLRLELKTLGGRTAALEDQKRQLEIELAALKAGKPSGERREVPAGGTGDGAAPKTVEIPENLRSDAEEFRESYPELYPLLEAAGPVGDRLRKLLGDSGADMAGLAAQNVVLQMELGRMRSEVREITQEEHNAKVEEHHPETRGYRSSDPALQEEYATFLSGLTAWIDRQPYADAVDMKRVLQAGRAGEVISLLDQYKKTLNKKPDTPLSEDKRRRAEEAGAVGNRRPVAPLAGAPDPDDYNGAIVEAFGLS
jgi:hypothetical protein